MLVLISIHRGGIFILSGRLLQWPPLSFIFLVIIIIIVTVIINIVIIVLLLIIIIIISGRILLVHSLSSR